MGVTTLRVDTSSSLTLVSTNVVPILNTAPTITGFQGDTGAGATLVTLADLATYLGTQAASFTSPMTLGSVGAAFIITGTTVAAGTDVASGAITHKANVGRGTGAVGGLVFQVPMLGSTGTTAQTLANAFVLDSIISTGIRACFDGSEVLPSGLSGTTGMNARGVRAFGLAAGGTLSVRRFNGTLATPTIIGNAETLGTLSFSGSMSATVLYSGATIVATSAEAWVNATSGGTSLTFNVTPNTTGTVALGMTLGQDKSLTVVGKFGVNGATAQASAVAGAALNAYGAGVNGLDSGANMSALHALVVAMRAALVANGIMSVA